MRVVFDVNFFVRIALGSIRAADLFRQTLLRKHSVLVSDELFVELAATVVKPRLQAKIRAEDYQIVRSELLDFATNISIQLPLPDCRDPKDRYLLAIARDGEAEFLVTNDKDLLCLSPFGRCQIVKPEVFAQWPV